MEGHNSVFSAVKRKARGFRSVHNLISMLYLTACLLNVPATPRKCLSTILKGNVLESQTLNLNLSKSAN
jgi:hypothetical protein